MEEHIHTPPELHNVDDGQENRISHPFVVRRPHEILMEPQQPWGLAHALRV